MTQFDAVVDYLRTHWKNCKMSPSERRADCNYYRTAGEQYGDAFADKLLKILKSEIEQK